jgi:hypothetical protein
MVISQSDTGEGIYILAAHHVRQLVFTHRLGQRQASVVLGIGSGVTVPYSSQLSKLLAGLEFLLNDIPTTPIGGRTLGPAEGAHWAMRGGTLGGGLRPPPTLATAPVGIKRKIFQLGLLAGPPNPQPF